MTINEFFKVPLRYDEKGMKKSKTEREQGWAGWCMYDWANSGFATVVLSAVFPVYFLALVPAGGAQISIFGWSRQVAGPALWGYVVSLSLLAVALSAPQLGRLADRRQWRRGLLMFFCLTGALATSLMVLVGTGQLLLAIVLFSLANFGFAASNIFYNAFLPDLGGEDGMDTLSARGFALGYIGGGLCLLVVFVMIQGYQTLGLADRGMATRFGLLFTGLWWALFSIPVFRALKGRTAPTTVTAAATTHTGYLATFRALRDYQDLLRFLIAFLFYNDGIQTLIVVAAVFAKDELGLSQATILGCFLMIQFVAMPGALLFGRLAARIGAQKAIALSLVGFISVVVYAWFINQAWQFWLLGAAVAVVLGGSQSISRSLYAKLIPAGRNAEFFGFYAISNKFAAILGPLVFALLTDITGSTRTSILALAAFFIIGMLLLTRVDVARGRLAARQANP
ncbi:MAG: MFS transporter [Deltaproteobacteria bacterium CG_4_10_14_3_um_filter_60_8]|nr:MAG: MFS transporter [Deltaproteobacteria bacterium CG_4_10_14_3_um_filter_60_8]